MAMNFDDNEELVNKQVDMNAYSHNLLKEKYPTKQDVITEIMNLEAILHLPKGTEHFVSDLHGEYTAFDHVLRNGSGSIKQKIQDYFSDRMTEQTMQDFALLIYYPEDELALVKKKLRTENELQQWYLDNISHLLEFLELSGSKYTRSKVRKALNPNFVYITEELLYNDPQEFNKRSYINQLLKNILKLDQADKFIIATCYTIQRLVVDHLHVLGDVYDRGEEPDKIMDRLMNYHSVDMQWGNHDLLWLGAMAGSKLCMLNLLRICARYNNLNIIEDAYGINLRHLSRFAEEQYEDNPQFRPKLTNGDGYRFNGEKLQITQIHQAVAMMQFKLEGQVIARRPELEMDDRDLLNKIDYKKNVISLNGKEYPLQNTCFNTVDPKNPSELTDEENAIVDELLISIQHSTKLKRHLDFMMNKGSIYRTYNGNLLFHGCIPADEKGNFCSLKIGSKEYSGKKLFDFSEKMIRKAYSKPNVKDDFATDFMWYLWQGALSPLFGKKSMTTFERYFIADKACHEEVKNPYYKLRENKDFCIKILQEFGFAGDDTNHIINGHTPVKRGHNAICAEGYMLVIDGGYSKAYQPTTGIAGYTLLYNSYGLQLVSHQPFTSKQDAIRSGKDIVSTVRVVKHELQRKSVADTDIGENIKEKIRVLYNLLRNYD